MDWIDEFVIWLLSDRYEIKLRNPGRENCRRWRALRGDAGPCKVCDIKYPD